MKEIVGRCNKPPDDMAGSFYTTNINLELGEKISDCKSEALQRGSGSKYKKRWIPGWSNRNLSDFLASQPQTVLISTVRSILEPSMASFTFLLQLKSHCLSCSCVPWGNHFYSWESHLWTWPMHFNALIWTKCSDPEWGHIFDFLTSVLM